MSNITPSKPHTPLSLNISSPALKPPTQPPSQLQVDADTSNNMRVDLAGQAEREAAMKARQETSPTIGNALENSLTGESFTKAGEHDKEAPATVEVGSPVSAAPKISFADTPMQQVVIYVDEHVANVQKQLREYIGKEGHNPFILGKAIANKHERFRKLIKEGKSEVALKKEAEELVNNYTFRIPDVSGQKFVPQEGY